MARLTHRIGKLEDRSRAQAVAEIRRAWDRLTDTEMALILAPFYAGRPPTTEEAAAERSFRETAPESLLRMAVGRLEELSEEEISRRVGELLEPIFRRRGRLVPQLEKRRKVRP